jgi:eukaryotic-like serine/threonine-protein kinase
MNMKGRIFMGRYEVKSLLGEGGMGRVYLAYDYNLKRNVVLKVMHEQIAADPKFRDRFEKEKLLTAQFEHAHAVRVYDASSDDPEGPFIVMEYIRGITLEELLQQNKGRLSAARVGRLLEQICDVLHAAHQRGIIHRDLKPANIMVVDPDSPKESIKVMDFGLAKLRSPQTLKEVVESHGEFAIGTPTYMCPEQVRGEELDHRSDIYSIGIILYELLTGKLPFSGGDAMDVLLAHATETPPSFAEVGVPDVVPSAVERVVLSCLAKDKADRPATALELNDRYQFALQHGAEMDELTEEPSEPTAPNQKGHGESSYIDPTVVVHSMEAWMPETIAVYKLQGFVQDAGGEVVENEPGRIRVLLGRPGTAYMARGGPFSWIGLGRKSGLIDVELRMEQADSRRPGLLKIAVLMRSPNGELPDDPTWRYRCNQVFIDLRGYLMGLGPAETR